MSINSELTRLDAVRDALVASVNSKGGNLAADATLWQVKAAVDGIEVGGGEDPTPVVTQPKPTVSVNSSNGLVTAKYTPVAGKVTDTSEKSATLQLTAQVAQTITPGTADKTIASGRYLTGTQTIKGDTNLTAGNIKNGVSIFGVAGEYKGEGGGGGAFDLVKVTEYTPYQAAFSGASKVTFAGFGYDDMTGDDFSVLNGDFTVENPGEADPLKRTFKKGEYYLYFYPDPDWNMGGDAWCLSKNKTYGGYNAWLFYNTSAELSSGSINWYSMMGGQTSTTTVTKTNYPEVQFSLKGQKATAYDPASKAWSFADSVLSFTGAEKALSLNGIYASTGTMLIGNRVAFGGDMPTAGMLLYLPFDSKATTAETGQTLEYSGSQAFTTLNGIPCMKIDSGYVKTTANSGITGSQSRSFSFWAYPTTGGTYVNAVGCGNERARGRMFNCGVRTDGANVRAEFTAWELDLDSVVCSADGKLHHFVYVFDQSTPTKVLVYVDGILALTHTVGDINTSASPFWIGQSGGGDWNYTGYLASVRCYNRVLSISEIEDLNCEHR